MFAKMLKGTEWSSYVDYMSPAFFEVVSPIGMMKEAGSLIKSSFDPARSKQLKLNTLKIFDLVCADKQEWDQHRMSLFIYFAQILHFDASLIDVRSTSFSVARTDANSNSLEWRPQPFFAEWQGDFLKELRELYLGFYSQDNNRFRQALEGLGIGPAEPQLKAHFGEGDQTAVVFRFKDFLKSFHNVFLVCKRHSLKLHPQFFSLGAALICLYENLERASSPIDVRSIFDLVASLSPQTIQRIITEQVHES